MKITPIILLFGIAIAMEGQAQDWRVTERGPNHRLLEREEVLDLGNGQVQRIPHQYVELATGLNYWDTASGQWRESRPEFEITPQGYAIASNLRHKVIISPILNDARGAVDMETPDGKQMRSTILGLVLRDRVTGNNSLVAEIKEGVVGRKVAPNRIVFDDCFDDIWADVRFTVGLDGFHQDVILREKLNPEWLEKNGFNAETTRLEIWTEFFEAPTPKVKSRVLETVKDATMRGLMAQPDVIEEELEFGSMSIPLGRAYAQMNGSTEGRSGGGLQVPKQWLTIEGRTFLVESMSLARLETLIAALPEPKAGGFQEERPLYAGRRPPTPKLTQTATNVIFTASIEKKADAAGVVLDYQTLNGSLTNYTFQGDLTYSVSGPLYLYGTTVVEGGAVLKYTKNTSAALWFYGPLDCQTAPYRQAIFTAKDDNSIGETISGSSGSPSGYYAAAALGFDYDGDVWLQHVRISYAQQAVYSYEDYAPTLTMRHIQVQNCNFGIPLECDLTLNLGNALFVDVNKPLTGYDYSSIRAAHVTASRCGNLVYDNSAGGAGFAFTNCVFANVTNLMGSAVGSLDGAHNAFYGTTNFGSASTNLLASPFQAVGGGSNYLAPDSLCRDLGTTNISSDLLADLRRMTTYPPVVHSNLTISTSMTLAPQAGRDTDTPDLGYHYDPMDHVIGGCDLSTNLTVSAGTVLGWFEKTGGVYSYSQPYALSLKNGANLSFEGTATQPTWFVRFTRVQEGSGNWPWRGWVGGLMIYGTGSPLPQLNATFTKWSTSAGYGAFFRDVWKYGETRISNSEFYGASMQAYGADFYYTNCLFYRPLFLISGDTISTDVTWRNCTFYNGAILLKRYSYKGTSSWWIENTAFDGTSIITYDQYNANTNYTYMDYNCFNPSNSSWVTHPYTWYGAPKTNVLEVAGTNDITGTNYFWLSGALGDFYVPDTSTLIDAGSTDADLLGLYHYTTHTNTDYPYDKEYDSPADIAYHYVGVNADGQPQDYDSDGVPDYLEDANGNGALDSGETDWQSASDTGLYIKITRPQEGSTLP